MKLAKPAAPGAPTPRVIPFQRPPKRRSEELAFLPAALEIVETPPSPVGRATAASILLLFCAALAWACWGTIDIVASAPGKILPSGRTKVVQPLESGVVRAIHVDDGDRVKAGDLLIELDPTAVEADRQRLAQFTLRHGMASMSVFRESVDFGGLMSYGPSRAVMGRRAADYVNRIARGAQHTTGSASSSSKAIWTSFRSAKRALPNAWRRSARR